MLYDDDFLKRLEDGVRGALPRWGLSPAAEVKLLTISENATFRVRDPAAGTLVFRVHRPGYHSRREIESELAWIEALRADAVVTTPRPIPLQDGTLVCDIDDAGTSRHVVAFEFVPGHEPPEGENLPGWFQELGAIHAKLHAHARRWPRPEGFTRKVWNFRTTLGEAPLWGDFRAALGLDAPAGACWSAPPPACRTSSPPSTGPRASASCTPTCASPTSWWTARGWR